LDTLIIALLNVTFNEEQIPKFTSTKYLGITFDGQLTWSFHMYTRKKNRLTIENTYFNTLPQFIAQVFISRNSIFLYSFIKLYAFVVYKNEEFCKNQKVQTFQFKTLRRITNNKIKLWSPIFKWILLKEQPIAYIITTTQSFWNYSNPLIEKLAASKVPENSHHYLIIRWCQFFKLKITIYIHYPSPFKMLLILISDSFLE